ncbi:MAG: hypothetical protein EOO73_34235 [Myxococcales bacterium]|nr:MAG: hypothetical protein EOO73_34235 [Myxococcales bacterium]
MATASPKKPELTSHADFLAAHASRVQSVHDLRFKELSEVDKARTRAETAFSKALEVAERDHAAERLTRHIAVVSESVRLLHDSLEQFETSGSSLGAAQITGQLHQTRDAISTRDIGQPLTKEAVIAECLLFHEKHPEAKALNRFAYSGNWDGLFDSGLSAAALRVSRALRNEFDLRGQQDALLALRSTVARIATAPGISAVSDEHTAELWPIISGVLPGDVYEARMNAHAKGVRARNAAEATAERDLQFRAIQGDQAARDEVHARGPGELAAILRGAAQIYHLVTGRQPLAQEARALNEGRGLH